MYKISEVAEILGINKVQIVEKMISQKGLLDPHISKKSGVTYFDKRGLEILESLINGKSATVEKVEEKKESIDLVQKSHNKRPVDKYDIERDHLKKEIAILKNQLLSLDSELRHKDEAIENYQRRILKDVELIKKLEEMLF